MKHILLVDGHEDSRDVLRTALEYHGYRITAEGDSGAALEAARRDRPDLAIVELYLHPMDGRSFMRALRTEESTRGVPIVCLTSRVMDADRRAALESGADIFLPKPLTPRQILEQVQALIG